MPGALGGRAASLLVGQLLPVSYHLTAPPGFAERRQIHIRIFHTKNQNREKQILGNGGEEGWSGQHPEPCPGPRWVWPSTLHSGGPLCVCPTWGSWWHL